MGPAELSMALIIFISGCIMIFTYCELGQMVNNQFEMFSDELDQCNWYTFALKMQQMLIIFTANAQQPTMIRGYGNVLCTRETLKKVKIIV